MQRIGLFILMCLITTISWAQKFSINGEVSDDNGPLPGASVVVKGSEATQINGTITNLDGKFVLEVNPDDILIVNYVGYLSEEIPVNGNNELNVLLIQDITSLDEVIVVGYGTQTKGSSVASISQTKGEDLLKVGSVTTVSSALQGMMAGVTAVADDGKPGADASEIFIRGKASWQSSDPLILVDGIERDMNDIDPNEIANISVLKDASATAVFGIRGGNGVILVTTKRGKLAKPQIGFSANFGIKVPTAAPEFSDYVTSMQMWNEALVNDKQWDQLIPESKLEAWENALASGNTGPYNDYFPSIDWYDQMVDKGYQQQYNLNVNGGTEFMKYFVSLGYLNDGDIYTAEKNDLFDPSFSYKRYNWRSNLDFNLTKTTLFSVNLSGKTGYRNQPGYRIDGGAVENGYGQEQFFNLLYTADEHDFPIQWSDGEYGSNNAGLGNVFLAFDKGQRVFKYYDGFLDFKLNQKLDFITKGLSTKGQVSFTTVSNTVSNIQRYEGPNFGQDHITYSRDFDYLNPNEDGTYEIISESRWPSVDAQETPPDAEYDILMEEGLKRQLYYELALDYSRSFEQHKLTVLALFSQNETNKIIKDSDDTFDTPYRQQNWVGRITYNYHERYLIEMNGAYTGSEAFAPGLRFGFFPSLTAGWRISEEPFVKAVMGEYLNNLKVKYSYGVVGFDNGANRFGYQQGYTSGENIGLGYDNKTLYGPLFYEGEAANINATWEEATKQNLGFELGLFTKLSSSIDFFKEHRTNILMDLWSPLWYVQKEATANLGETKNHGIDFELGWNDRVGLDFNYWVKGVVSVSENRIIARNDGVYEQEHLQEAGKPIGWQSRYIQNGYYQDLDDIYNYSTPNSTTIQSSIIPGDFMYNDYNADGIVDDLDKVVTEDLKYPLQTASISFGASYKGWSLNVLFYGVSDVNKEVPAYILWDNVQGGQGVYKTGTNVLSRWTPINAASAGKPSLHSQSEIATYSREQSTYTYQDAAYVRLKNIELGYSFNKRILSVLRMSKLQLYANGNNLVTWTNLDKRLDPEATKTGAYPLVKRINFGLRTTF